MSITIKSADDLRNLIRSIKSSDDDISMDGLFSIAAPYFGLTTGEALINKASEMQEQEPTCCVKCQSEEISASNTESDHGVISRPASCDDCGHEWTEVFAFSHCESQ